jgi:hypothetical protein
MRKSKILAMDEANADVLVQLITGPNISEALRIQAMEKLTESKQDPTFFKTMLIEKLSYGSCPECGHKNHWLIDEETLNTMGYVSSQEDPRVPEFTTDENCELYQQACLKKKIVI